MTHKEMKNLNIERNQIIKEIEALNYNCDEFTRGAVSEVLNDIISLVSERLNKPPLIGAEVIVHLDKSKNREYTAEGTQLRKEATDGPGVHVGKVIEHSDSHGLCYRVKLLNGKSAWFEPEELEV